MIATNFSFAILNLVRDSSQLATTLTLDIRFGARTC